MSTLPARFRRVLLAGALLLSAAPLVLAEPPARKTDLLFSSALVVDASVDALWSAYTERSGIEALRGGRAEVDLRLGGTLRWHPSAAAAPDSPGWTTEHVLAYVPRSVLAVRSGAESAWTVTTFEPLGRDRTRVHTQWMGPPLDPSAGAHERQGAYEALAGSLAPLKKRFPARVVTADPVEARFVALRGTWETRSNAPKEKPAEVQGRLVIETGGQDRAGKSSFAVIRRFARVGEDLRLERVHHFWRESDSGTWRGATSQGSSLATWDVAWDLPSKSLHWGEGGPGGRCQEWLTIPADDGAGAVHVSEGAGCIGSTSVWTRVPAPR